ncbi:MAG: autotransporter-associated beta strand repeat-containing protein, partial [Deltaproteobacteria bacterium]|nr:autotransporter-associated beta strand repeat-containing protein [Deltaproteobacteria bacterium]
MTPATAIRTRSGIIIPALSVFITCLLAQLFPVFADYSHIVTVDTDNSNVDFYGNSSDDSGIDYTRDPTENHLIIESSGKVHNAFGAYYYTSSDVSVSDNKVTVQGIVNSVIRGGQAVSLTGGAEASQNSVVIDGGTSEGISGGGIWGGYARAFDSGNVNALNNTITIESGTIGDIIIIGGNAYSYLGTAIATGNTINVNGGDFDPNASIRGGVTETTFGTAGDSFSGNTLNMNSSVVLYRANNFQFVNFGYNGTADITTLDTTPTGSDKAGVTLNTDSYSVNFKGTIQGSGSLTKTGSGTLTLTGTNTYYGGTTVSEGTLGIGNGGNSGIITGDIDIEINASLVFNRSDAVTYGDIISGTGSLTKDGGGTLTLVGANTYSGGTTVSDGILEIGNDGTVGSITGDIETNASLVFNRSDAVMYGGIISGTGSLTKGGGGTLTLAGANTYSGGTTVSVGTLVGRIANNTDLTVESGASYETGGESRALSALNGSGDIVNSDGLTVQSGSFGGAITGTGSLTKTGRGT